MTQIHVSGINAKLVALLALAWTVALVLAPELA